MLSSCRHPSTPEEEAYRFRKMKCFTVGRVRSILDGDDTSEDRMDKQIRSLSNGKVGSAPITKARGFIISSAAH